MTPAEISALSRAGYGRNDGDGRFWNDDEKKVVKTSSVARDTGEVVRTAKVLAALHCSVISTDIGKYRLCALKER